ncbi:MAG: hypothetical protein Q9M27_02395, partial [Mariprofundaceae bacterium]|nr:hypothetical protein [Mariprofundaceae bacterium]
VRDSRPDPIFLQMGIMMKGIGRDMQAVFLVCVQAALIMGLMLSGTPSGMAAGSVTPCVHADSTQTESTKIHTSAPGHVNNRVTKTFDMNMLIGRLKKTDAIGMFTKLVLRSDALDIMDMIKAYNRHVTRYSLKDLRAQFDGLVLKVLALLNDDPKLARDISLARENIWKNLLEVKA